MTNIARLAALSLLALAVTACSDDSAAPEADAVTETKMDEVDVIDGTISDDMVDVDTQKSDSQTEEATEDGDESADGDKAETATEESETEE